MNKYVCIAFGVSRCGSLFQLPGAINGAQSFAVWAEPTGYQVHLVTDENGRPVKASVSMAAIIGKLASANFTRKSVIVTRS
jgi:hypothetical protein